MAYNRTEVSQGIDTNKTRSPHKCIVCHYWYFLMISFRFQLKICYGFHDMTQKYISFGDVTVVIIERNSFRIHFWFITRSETVDRIKNTHLSEKWEQLSKNIKILL